MWNPSDVSGVAVSSDGASISANVDGTPGGARSITAHSSGKWGARAIIANSGGTYEFGVSGVGGSLATERAAGRVIVERNGDIYTNGSNDDFIGGAITNHEVDLFVDFGAGTVVFRSQFVGDPVGTLTAGTSIASLGGVAYLYGLSNLGAGSDNITLSTIPTIDLPSGFTNWDDVSSSTIGESPSSAAESDAALSERISSDKAASNKRAHDALSSDKPSRDAFSSDKIGRDALSSEQASSEFQSDLADEIPPPIQVVVILSS